MWTEMVLPDGV